MAVPKKKVSFSSKKKKNNLKYLKNFKCRKLNYSVLELMQFVVKKDNWMALAFIKHNKKKYKLF